ncbi:MAG: 3-deoxy-7-phosphoheptulonate synthase [Clostridia bacterium]|nr:3-deoxy-7-phosphoheptulonate synthase [Oscillospiraceae bacterium]MBQ6797060.1 3-deoxy-7-phosphoheptulonate synthase [Clostridia bacterium]
MIIKMKRSATGEQIGTVINRIGEFGLGIRMTITDGHTLLTVTGGDDRLGTWTPIHMPGVESFTLDIEHVLPEKITVSVGGQEIGSDKLCMIAGPRIIESEERIFATARELHKCGIKIMRGGSYSPNTSPYAFRGLESEGLRMLRSAADQYGLLTVSEVVSLAELDNAAKYCDILQIGARNMQNYRLLQAVGKTDKPVMLKRGVAATVDEWLDSAEYILREGNSRVILCERGIRTFETATKSTIDIAAITSVREKSGLPVIVDPSKAAPHGRFVPSLSLASVAAGADGLMIDAHPNPAEALSDSAQQLSFSQLSKLIDSVRYIALAMGKSV